MDRSEVGTSQLADNQRISAHGLLDSDIVTGVTML